MKLNHLDLQVSDVQAAVSFFETHFGLTLTTSRSSPALAVLSDRPAADGPGDGFVLVLQRKKDGAQTYPDGFHLGFLVEDIATVEATHRSLLAAGADVSAIDTNNRGTMLYCRIADGILVEVNCPRKR